MGQKAVNDRLILKGIPGILPNFGRIFGVAIEPMSLQKTIFRFSTRAMIVAVYGIFFAVQIFFNFASGKNIINSKVSYSSACISKFKQVTKNPKSGSHQLGFRLNKHFHPKFLPSGIFSQTTLPVYFVDQEKISFYAVAFISSPFCCSSQLRGPPVMNSNS